MDERRQSRAEVVVDGGPGYGHMIYVLMEGLLDKLKLLNYDSEFTQEFKMKFINRLEELLINYSLYLHILTFCYQEFEIHFTLNILF